MVAQDKEDGGASERGEDTEGHRRQDERRKLKHKTRNRLVDPWSKIRLIVAMVVTYSYLESVIIRPIGTRYYGYSRVIRPGFPSAYRDEDTAPPQGKAHAGPQIRSRLCKKSPQRRQRPGRRAAARRTGLRPRHQAWRPSPSPRLMMCGKTFYKEF